MVFLFYYLIGSFLNLHFLLPNSFSFLFGLFDHLAQPFYLVGPVVFLTVFWQISVSILNGFLLKIQAVVQLEDLPIDIGLLSVTFGAVDLDLDEVA